MDLEICLDILRRVNVLRREIVSRSMGICSCREIFYPLLCRSRDLVIWTLHGLGFYLDGQQMCHRIVVASCLPCLQRLHLESRPRLNWREMPSCMNDLVLT